MRNLFIQSFKVECLGEISAYQASSRDVLDSAQVEDISFVHR